MTISEIREIIKRIDSELEEAENRYKQMLKSPFTFKNRTYNFFKPKGLQEAIDRTNSIKEEIRTLEENIFGLKAQKIIYSDLLNNAINTATEYCKMHTIKEIIEYIHLEKISFTDEYLESVIKRIESKQK